MNRIAVYRMNGTLFAEFCDLTHALEVMKFNEDSAIRCLAGLLPRVKSGLKFRRKATHYVVREIDESTHGRC
jgi:hypothetical protein